MASVLILLQTGIDVLFKGDEAVFIDVSRDEKRRDVFLLQRFVHLTHLRGVHKVVRIQVKRNEVLLVTQTVLLDVSRLWRSFLVSPLSPIIQSQSNLGLLIATKSRLTG